MTGDYQVGRQEFAWTDLHRPETLTQDLDDRRQVGLVVWYPAESGTGSPAPYVPDLDAIKSGLIASGEFNSMEAAGLGLVRSHSFADAPVNSTAEACRTSTAVSACMNIDGQAAGGPFGTAAEPAPVGRPFMYLTKEFDIHPTLAATFESSGSGTFRVVVRRATQEQFADGPLLQPGLWPLDRTADHVHTVTEGSPGRSLVSSCQANPRRNPPAIWRSRSSTRRLSPRHQSASVRTSAGCSASSGS